MDALQSDLRYAVRSFRKSPAFQVAPVLTLAPGIAANPAVFSLVDGILLRPLPYPDADRIVMLVNTWSGNSSPIESSTRTRTSRHNIPSSSRWTGPPLHVCGRSFRAWIPPVEDCHVRESGERAWYGTETQR